MKTPQGIIIFGANGSGKTTLGRELSRVLGFKRMDAEDYYFREAEIPYSDSRSKDEVIGLMLPDIEKHRMFIISTCIGDLGDIIPQYYRLAIYIKAPYELRMEHVKQRVLDRFGERVLEGAICMNGNKSTLTSWLIAHYPKSTNGLKPCLAPLFTLTARWTGE